MLSCFIYGRKKYKKFDKIHEEIKEILVELIEKYQADEFLIDSKGKFGVKCIEVLTELSEKYALTVRVCDDVSPMNYILVSDMMLAAIWKRDKKGAKCLNYAWKLKKLNLNMYTYFIEGVEKKIKTFDDYIERQNDMKEAKSFLRIQQRIFQEESTKK